MKPRPQLLAGGAALVAALGHLALAYATPRPHFGQLLLLWAGLLLAYILLLNSRISWRQGLLLGLGLRLLWLPATPALSDDFHRFRWDGLLVAQGINPFQFRPRELVDAPPAAALPPALRTSLKHLLPRLNSPDYYSVYPPVCQFIFGLGAALCPTSEIGFVILLRLFILAAEIASFWLMRQLLQRLGKRPEQALSYFLHPLVITELTGNLHFEALVISFVLLAVWLLGRQRLAASALALALSVGTKLLPILVLPLLLKRLGWPRFGRYAAVSGGTIALLFLPFASSELISHLGSSLHLYFHRFEFNASLYYGLRAIGFWLRGYNEIAIIGPALGLLAALTVLVVTGRQRRSLAQLPASLLLVLSVYYLCATTVHPWYLTPLIAVSVFTRFRFPLVWGGLAVLSYAAYRQAIYAENLWLVGLEYALTLGWLCNELLVARPPRPLVPAPGA